LSGDKIMARRYRNRRIGEFLKELKLTEGRCTGIPKIRRAMAHNSSPPPRFSSDEGRTYFLAELPVHPELPGIGQAHDEAHDEAHEEASDEAQEERTEPEVRVPALVENQPRSPPETAEPPGLKSRSGPL